MRRTRTIIELIVVTLIVACLSAIGFIEYGKGTQISAVPAFIPVAAVPTPTDNPQPILQTTSMESPEGSRVLTLERVEHAGSVSHSAYTIDPSSGKRYDIISFDTQYQDLSIPYNTWSPDTLYVFLKETTSTKSAFLVFQSMGGNFANGNHALSINDEFAADVQGFEIKDVTGWASPTQLIVNTRSLDSDAKVSFWFDVPSQTFTQLGTYFR